MTAQTPEQRLLLGQLPLTAFFKDEEHLATSLAAASYKVVGVLVKARHPVNGKDTGVHNYVAGLAPRLNSLVNYVANRVKLDDVYCLNNLPTESAKLTKQQWRRVLDQVHYRLIELVLEYWHEDRFIYLLGGDWCFVPSLHEDHDRLARRANDAWYNQRNWHGRPSEQGRRRARANRQAPGTSIGTNSSKIRLSK